MVDAQAHTTKYAYDDAGNQVSITDPNNHITPPQYDSPRRLKKTIDDDSTGTQYSYDGRGNQLRLASERPAEFCEQMELRFECKLRPGLSTPETRSATAVINFE